MSKFSNNKKGIELAMNAIVITVIVLIVAVIVLFIFQHYYGKEAGIIGEQIEQLDDYDNDGIANLFDKCPCKGSAEDECSGDNPNNPDRSCLT